MEWNDSFSVNIRIVDEQHKRLVKLVGVLQKATDVDQQDQDFIKSILDELVEYTVKHFTVEEEIMDIYNYPGLEDHKKEHKQFVDKVTNLVETYNSGEMILMHTVVSFLEKWIENHIKGSDQKIGPHCNSQGLN
jgi:hemerythrin